MLTGCLAQADDELPERSRAYSYLFESAINPAREMAQTHQESAWIVTAQSPYAKGLRQFTDATGQWLARTKCKSLGSYQPFNPIWSIRCGVIYQESLQTRSFGDYCNNRKVAEQRYNGGGWVLWELKTANSLDLADAEIACQSVLFNGRKRNSWACKENYEYPKHITKRVDVYSSMGGELCAE